MGNNPPRYTSSPTLRAREITTARLIYALEHAGASTFVTSFTTSAAFMANSISSIVAVKCFGLFAALVIMCDYILMITFLPAIVVVFDEPTAGMDLSARR